MVSQGLRDTPYSRKACLPYGFTLIELIVVIAILGILAAIAIPRLAGFQTGAKEKADYSTANTIGVAASAYIADHPTAAAADITVAKLQTAGLLPTTVQKPQSVTATGWTVGLDANGNVTVSDDRASGSQVFFPKP